MYQLGKFTIIVLIAVIHFEVVEDRLMEIESKTAKVKLVLKLCAYKTIKII